MVGIGYELDNDGILCLNILTDTTYNSSLSYSHVGARLYQEVDALLSFLPEEH